MIAIDINKLYHFFLMLKHVNEETRLYLDKSIWYRTVDNSNVCMQECRIEAEECLVFDEEPKEVGIYLPHIMPFLYSHRNDGVVKITFTLEDEKEKKYKILFETDEHEFTIITPALDTFRRTPNELDLKGREGKSNDFNITTEQFKNVLKDIGAKTGRRMSDAIGVTIDTEKDTLSFENMSSGCKSTRAAKCYLNTNINCHFSSNYLKEFLSKLQKRDIIYANVCDDKPIIMKVQSNPSFHNVYYLAPRIMSDD